MSFKEASIQAGMFKTPPFSLEAPDYSPIEGETIPRRNPQCVNGLKSIPEEGVHTLFDVLVRASEKFGDLDGVGTRNLIKTHHETKMVKKVVDGKEVSVEKKWTYFEMGKFEYHTFGEYVKMVLQIGSGFRKLGLVEGDRVHIFAATSAHWLATAHGATTQSMPIVTSYATLGQEGLTMSLLQTHAKAIFVDPDLIPNLIKSLQKAKELKFVIYNNEQEVDQKDIDKLKEAYPHFQILSLEELRRLGELNPIAPVPPKPDDLCCIMYTSGTTGAPKGVPLTHRNIVAAIAGLEVVFSHYVSPRDSVLAYLPLAHSFEWAFENCCLYWGMKMGYGSPRTLSDTNMKNCVGDIKEFRPTILVGVPAVWETIRKGIEEKVSRESALVKNVFWGALVLKSRLCEWKLPGAGILDYFVFKTVKNETGGRLRACFNGAGPLGKETRRFISYAVVPLISGYGLTETTAMGALQDPLEWTDDTLGDIPGCIEIKLVDFPEAGYFATNTPPQGEILIHGDAVMEGYYENDEETAKAMAPGGWFRTGDIGEWAPNGHLRIIDRKKNLVKTLNGEYIALEKLESVYRSANIVTNICVFAAADRAKPIAIVIPTRQLLLQLAEVNDIVEKSHDALIHDEKVKGLLLKELQGTGRKAGLAGFEIIEGVVLTDSEWTPQNGLLTPAQKLNRRMIVKMYQKEIDAAYGRTKSVL